MEDEGIWKEREEKGMLRIEEGREIKEERVKK